MATINVQATPLAQAQESSQQQKQRPDHQAEHAAAVLNLNQRAEHTGHGTKTSFQILGVGKLSGPGHRRDQEEGRKARAQQTAERMDHDDVQTFVVGRTGQRHEIGVIDVRREHRQPDRPPGQRSFAEEPVLTRLCPSRDVKAVGNHTAIEHKHDQPVDQRHVRVPRA